MIHFWFEIFTVDQFANVDVVLFRCFFHQMLQYTINSFLVVVNDAADMEMEFKFAVLFDQ